MQLLDKQSEGPKEQSKEIDELKNIHIRVVRVHYEWSVDEQRRFAKFVLAYLQNPGKPFADATQLERIHFSDSQGIRSTWSKKTQTNRISPKTDDRESKRAKNDPEQIKDDRVSSKPVQTKNDQQNSKAQSVPELRDHQLSSDAIIII